MQKTSKNEKTRPRPGHAKGNKIEKKTLKNKYFENLRAATLNELHIDLRKDSKYQNPPDLYSRSKLGFQNFEK